MTEIPTDTPLTRLNYFNGKFMRAEHLRGEQFYMRSLVHLTALSGGHGVVYGFDTTLTADRAHIVIGPGLAISGQGRLLYFPATTTITISDLLERSQESAATPTRTGDVFTTDIGDFEACAVSPVTGPDGQPSAGPLYVLQIAPVDAYCGTEDVFGKLCEDACVTSSERPYIIEGLLVKADPLELTLPSTTAIAFTDHHLRSRAASAYFAREFDQGGHLISRSGLAQDTWCLGSRLTGGACVPIAVFAVNAGTATFLDPWIARRERIETPARRYWAFKMRMRPWDIFLAQVLQFQCQLRELLDPATTPLLPAPCDNERGVLAETRTWLENLRIAYERALADATGPINFPVSLTEIQEMGTRIDAVVGGEALPATSRTLIDGGIIELPAAGYLPIDKESFDTVNIQVRRLMGEGVNLRFCTVRPDYVAHALEEAQHMDRISLLEGLVDPDNKPDVDILVPDGLIISESGATNALGFRGRVSFDNDDTAMRMQGVARGERLLTGGAAVYFAGNSSIIRTDSDGPIRPPTDNPSTGPSTRPGFATAAAGTPLPGEVWFQLVADKNPLELAARGTFGLDGRIVFGDPGEDQHTLDAFAHATVTIDSRREDEPGVSTYEGRLRVSGSSASVETPGEDPDEESFVQRMSIEAQVDLNANSAEITLRPQTSKNANDRAELTITVNMSPLRVAMTLTVYSTNSDGLEEVDGSGRANFIESDVALQAGPMRRAAERAIDALARKIEDDTAAETWRQLLFRILEENEGELTMRAVRDWVLFHRRRRRICELGPPPVVAQPPRRYDVFHILLTPNQPATTILPLIAQMEAGDATAAMELLRFAGGRSIFPVEYEGGDDDVLTNQTTLLADYRAALPGNTMIATVIATAGEEDNDTLEAQRITSLETVLDDVTTANTSTERHLLVDVPAAFVISDSEGFILLVTEQRAAVETHDAYAIFYTPDTESVVEGYFNANDITALTTDPNVSRRLTETSFEQGTSNLLTANPPLADAWTPGEAQNYYRSEIRAYGKRQPPNVTDFATYLLSQSRKIDADMLAPQVPTSATGSTNLYGETLPVACDNLTFFIVRPTQGPIFSNARAQVRFLYRAQAGGGVSILRFDNSDVSCDETGRPDPAHVDALVRSIVSLGFRRFKDWAYGLRTEDALHAERMKLIKEALIARGMIVEIDPRYSADLWSRTDMQPFKSPFISDLALVEFTFG